MEIKLLLDTSAIIALLKENKKLKRLLRRLMPFLFQ